MKKVFRRIIAISLAFVFLVSSGCSKKKSNTIEGKGYDSPEEAAAAFAEALKKQDTEKMLSTFAIETYCSNYDAYLNMVRMKSLTLPLLYNEPLAPEGAPYLHEANAYNRAGNLARNIEYLYTNILASGFDSDAMEAYESIAGGRIVDVTDPESMDSSRAFLDAMTGIDDLDIEVGEVYGAEYLTEKFYYSMNLNGYYSQAKVRNADGYKSLGVALKVNGQNMIITMDTIKYGKKWYVATLGGLLSMNLGLTGFSAGLIPEEQIEEMGLIQDMKKRAKNVRKELKDLEDEWDEEHEKYMEEYEALTEDLSKEEIEELIYGEDWRMDPRCNVYSLSYDEMLEFFDMAQD